MKTRLNRIALVQYITVILILGLGIPRVQAQIYPPDGLRMPGDWNNWENHTGMGGDFDLQRIATGTLRWQTRFQYTGETGPQDFKFVSTTGFDNDSWGNQWAANTSVSLNILETFNYGTPAHPDNTVELTQNNWYTVVFEDNGYANARAVFMETNQEPVKVASLSQQPLLVEEMQEVEVHIQLESLPGEEEFFYLRYTTDQWTSSSILLVEIENQLGIATIPGYTEETMVEYYVFSSVIENIEADFDLFSLHIFTHHGHNFSYLVGQQVECGQQTQLLTTDPAFPLEDNPLILYFNAEMGNGGLLNYEGDVYAHTGVITSESEHSGDWKYVVTEWGENTEETRLTRLADNLYSLEIEDIRNFYQVPPAEDILQLAFVFRSEEPDENGNYLEHKNVDNSDIFVNIYEPELNVKILSPDARQPLASPNQLLAICVEALQNENLSIFLNDQLLYQESTSSLTWGLDMQTLDPGTHWIKAYASYGNQQVSDSVAIYLRGPVIVEELPENVQNGINYIDNQTVTLVLHDPPGLKQFAFAIGDYSNWLPNDDNYMKRTPDGTRFWVTISGLQPDTEYAFQYFIDGEIRLADAYAEKILDPWNDRYIPQETYPNLKEYPFEKTTGIVSIMHSGRAAYEWEIPDFTPVAIHGTQSDLVIYELLVRDFLESRKVADIIEKLDYLEDLGVNAIQLMPIMEFDGNDSWGYAPNFFFATDKYYGTREAYKNFIDEAHKRGMAVILDVVPNHAFGQSPMVNMYFDPNAGEYGQPLPENPWFNQQAPHPYSVGYDFNHESPYVRTFFKRVFEYWLTEFNADGYRIDLSKGLTQNYSGDDMGAWSAYDQSRIDILIDYYNHIKSVKPDAYVILEHFAHNDEETVLANNGMLLWSAMHDNYAQVAMGHQQNSDLSWAYHANRGWNYPNLIDYMENHDEERLMYEALTYGNSAGDYDLGDTLTALGHMEMAAVLFLGIPGPKMIWQFGELGYDYSIFYNGGRTAAKPVRWDYWDMPQRQKLHRVYNAMIQLRTHDAFRFGEFTHDFHGLGKRMWIAHASMNVVIAANMGVEGFDMAPGFQHAGTWYDYFSGESVDVTDPAGHSFYFAPGSYRVFTNEPLARPFFNLQVIVKDKANNQAVEGAKVEIERSGSRLTSEEGMTNFTSLEGSFGIEVSKPGFHTHQATIEVNQDLQITVLLETDGTGILLPGEQNLAMVYPNPAGNQFTIEAEPGTALHIYNMQGRLIHHFTLTGDRDQVNTQQWPPGIYMIRATKSGKASVIKLVIH